MNSENYLFNSLSPLFDEIIPKVKLYFISSYNWFLDRLLGNKISQELKIPVPDIQSTIINNKEISLIVPEESNSDDTSASNYIILITLGVIILLGVGYYYWYKINDSGNGGGVKPGTDLVDIMDTPVTPPQSPNKIVEEILPPAPPISGVASPSSTATESPRSGIARFFSSSDEEAQAMADKIHAYKLEQKLASAVNDLPKESVNNAGIITPPNVSPVSSSGTSTPTPSTPTPSTPTASTPTPTGPFHPSNHPHYRVCADKSFAIGDNYFILKNKK